MSVGWWRLAAVLALLAVAAVVPTARLAPAAAATPGLALLDQSSFVQSSGTFRIRLAVPASASETIDVRVLARLTTRTDFDRALGGQTTGRPIYDPGAVVSSLPVDPAGGIDLEIPINTNSSTGSLPTFNARSGSSVYPLRLQLYQDGSPVGAPLDTFLIYASGPATATDFPRLSVSVTLPVRQPTSVDAAGDTVPLSAADASALGDEVTALAAHGDVPVTLGVGPQTVEALAAGSGADRATVSALAAILRTGGDEVVAAPYVPLNLPGIAAAGLASEVATQTAAGAAALSARLGRAPSAATWSISGGLDPATLTTVAGLGADRLIVPPGDLTALPQDLPQTTFAQPAVVAYRNTRVAAYAADGGLAAHFVNGGDQVLAAHQLLAELSMVQLETPGKTRGVAVVAPAGWHPNAAFLDALLGGLRANPLLAPVTADGLFAAVAPATEARAPLERGLTATKDAAAIPDVGALRSARTQLAGFEAIVAPGVSQSTVYGRRILAAEAVDLSSGLRSRILAGLVGTIKRIERSISLPGSSSITLTARQGNVPLTVLSDPSLAARLELRLTSQKLVFRPYTPPGGRCTVQGETTMVCELRLTSEATTIKVPVEARTSGVFTLQVVLQSPGGAVVLGANRDTVRSTVVSGVGVVLIVLAALGLAFWWIRNFRHGRRARDLVDPDTAEIALPEVAEARGHRPPPLPEDQAISDFFASPPPRYPDVSPSGPARGPNS